MRCDIFWWIYLGLPETDPNADTESPFYRPPMENVPEQVGWWYICEI